MQPNPDYADLDALPSDLHWGVMNPMLPSAQTDVDWVTGGLAFQPAAEFYVMPNATWQKCRDQTGYDQSGSLKTPNITPGMTICVVTGAGRISIVKVVSLPDYGNSYIDLYVTTYNPPVFPNREQP
jgi:hypothetical protein